MSNQEIKNQAGAFFRTVIFIVETIREGGSVNGGLLYAALLNEGIIGDIPTFNKLMQFVTSGGTIVKDGPNYRPATEAEIAAFDAEVAKNIANG